MSTALVPASQVAKQEQFTQEQVQLLKDTVCKGATDNELALFRQVCQTKQLDPFSKQIYAIKRWDPDTQREVMTFQTGIDGFRIIAERSGSYAGQSAPLWCGDDGKWVDVWLSPKPPAAAKVSVFRHGFKEPLTRVAKYSEYVQLKKDKTPTRMWATMPANQLAKCCEGAALRAAFPEQISGLYVHEEMQQADREDDAPKRGSRASAQSVAETKIKALEAGATPAEASAAVSGIVDAEFEEVPDRNPPADADIAPADQINFKNMMEAFAAIKPKIGDEVYYRILTAAGVEHANKIRPLTTARKVYKAMLSEHKTREDRAEWTEKLKLAEANFSKAFWVAMGAEGFGSIEEIPAGELARVFCEIEKAVAA